MSLKLAPRLEAGPALVRREVLRMLSEIGGDESVDSIAALLGDRELHEDARAALERIPGGKSLAALQDGLRTAPEAFKPAIAQSLRVRGVNVSGYPSQKLVPTRPSQADGEDALDERGSSPSGADAPGFGRLYPGFRKTLSRTLPRTFAGPPSSPFRLNFTTKLAIKFPVKFPMTADPCRWL